MNDKEAAKAEFEAAVSKGLDAGLVSCLWLVELLSRAQKDHLQTRNML